MALLAPLGRSDLGLFALAMTAAHCAWAQDIPLAPGESVEVVVYGREDMSGERAIDRAGLLLVPFLGRVAAAGATTSELEARVESELAEAGLVVAPEVFVDIVRRRDVYVGGAVENAGAVAWTPGVTVEQVVTQAGGPRMIPSDEFGTLLQAHGTVEEFEALMQSIAELEAREARLEAETAFVDIVFARSEVGGAPAEPGELSSGASPLDLAAFLPPDTGETVPEDEVAIIAGYDIVQFRRLQRESSALSLILFPKHIAEDPLLADVRVTQQELIADHLALHLTRWNSLALQREALVRQTAAYEEQRVLVEANLDQLAAQLQNVRSLRESGLARESDLLDLQAAYATLLSSRVALLSAIADTETRILQQDLEIQSFSSNLRSNLGRELEAVRGELSQARSREDEARRAAAVAAAYKGTGHNEMEEPSLLYEIRRGGDGDLQPADPSTEVLPGDVVVVSLIEDF